MSVAKQLYQLQEVDQEIESTERTLNRTASQLGESQAVLAVQTKLDQEQQHLHEVKARQHAAEWEMDDLASKLAAEEGKLYSGKITNPKELSGIQRDAGNLRARHDQVENEAIEIMEQLDLATASAANLESELKTLKSEWQSQQQQLTGEMEHLKSTLSDLYLKRQQLAVRIDTQAVEFYDLLREQKRTAVAKIEQGICRGCRISLSTTELQRAKTGRVIQCSSCGRILFLA